MASPRTQSAVPAIAMAAALGACVAIAISLPGSARAQNVVKFGTTDSTRPSCPAPRRNRFPAYRACNAFGHVTGFQLRTARGGRAISRVPRAGRIVAWSVRLTRPSREERQFFAEFLSDDTFDRHGANPVAGISILNRVGKGRFKLTKQSPLVDLSDSLGEQPIITLDEPIRVREGRIVGLTTPTWLTNFAIANRRGRGFLAPQNVWRASRSPQRCENESPDDIRNLTERSRPHVRDGQTRRYGCVYQRAQIVYEVYLVPNR